MKNTASADGREERAKKQAQIVTADGRPLLACDADSGSIKLNHHPIRCNRVRGHQGPHQHVVGEAWTVDLEWE